MASEESWAEEDGRSSLGGKEKSDGVELSFGFQVTNSAAFRSILSQNNCMCKRREVQKVQRSLNRHKIAKEKVGST